MHHYNKLIRDKMPEVAKKEGKQISYRNATTDEEYWYLLKNKLQEEVRELGEKDTTENIVDILDVMDAIIEFKKLDPKMLGAFRENRIMELGAFNERLVLEESDQEVGKDQEQLI
jgi:predicted house-cleaning noncanonical NTP pyrophosphatase (MazG superfamily)